jgi:hypothetical protein
LKSCILSTINPVRSGPPEIAPDHIQDELCSPTHKAGQTV